MIMKYVTSLATTVLALVLATPAYAGTLSLAPSAPSLRVGQTISVIVSANPGPETQYTVKAMMSFSPNTLEVTGFTYNSAWTPLAQPGYDSVDNTAGTMVKTAGYPGGFTINKPFGTITFRAKAAGTATVSISGASLMLNSTNQNTYTSGGVTTTTLTVGAAPSATPRPSISVRPTAIPSVTAVVSQSPTPSATPNTEVATIGSNFTSSTWFRGLSLAVIAILVGLWLTRQKSPQSF
jgi:hypothetical protein